MEETPWLWFFPRADLSLHDVAERAISRFGAAGLVLQPEEPSKERGVAGHRLLRWALTRGGAALPWVDAPLLEDSPEGPRLRFVPHAPLSLELTGHELSSPVPTTALLTLSRALLGQTAPPLEGLARMFEEDIQRLGPWPEVEPVRDALARALEEARAFDMTAREWRAGALEAVEAFLADVVSPERKVVRGPRQREAALPLSWPEPTREQWCLEAWVARLSWNAPGQERAIAYWKAEGPSPRWEALARLCTAKSTFDAQVDILAGHGTEESLRELARFVADPNWPGAAHAWTELYRLGVRARPALEGALRDAEACGDTGWRDVLLDLLEQLPSGSEP